MGSGCVAQLVERSLPIPEVRIQSSAKFIEHLFTVNCIEKTKIKRKEAGNGPFLKKNCLKGTKERLGMSHI